MELCPQFGLVNNNLLNNGRYEIIKPIGSGGSGNVYLVIDNNNCKEQ